MANSARAFSTNLLTELVNQNLHGFSVGQVVVFNNAMNKYVLSQANSLLNCLGTVMVSIVVNPNSFYFTQNGFVSALTGPLFPGLQYYVSPTFAGKLTVVQPTDVGLVNLPCFVADSVTSGYFYTGSGELILSGDESGWNHVSANTNIAVNNSYFTTNGAGTINMLLPDAAVLNDTFQIANYGAGNFSITQAHNQSQVLLGGAPSTAGAAGSVTSTEQYSKIKGVCVAAPNPNDTVWFLMDVLGNFTVV